MEMKLFDRLENFISSCVDKTDPHRQFSTPFKSAYFQQDWTCCIPFTVRQINYNNWFSPDREKTRVLMTLIHRSPSSTTIVAKCSPQN
jgi:hypothetical protein